MSETTTIEMTAAEKPYTFRKLAATDIFPMSSILSKIGLNKFASCLEKDSVSEAFKAIMANSGEKTGESNLAFMGITVALEIASVILSNLEKCESDIYRLLAQISNLSQKEVKALDAAVFFEMIVDFIKKEEFKDFLKVVSKLFN